MFDEKVGIAVGQSEGQSEKEKSMLIDDVVKVLVTKFDHFERYNVLKSIAGYIKEENEKEIERSKNEAGAQLKRAEALANLKF